jgi:predicted nucleic acid-binding protein
MRKGVFCDTSFFIRLLDKNDPLHEGAKNYFRYLIESDFKLCISTIAIAEYCVAGNINELPLKNLQIVPFNLNHSQRTGEFAKIAFQAKKADALQVSARNLIPNDTKLFAQADCEEAVEYYLSSDTESKKIYNLLGEKTKLKFQFIDLNTPCAEAFRLLFDH